MKDCIFCKIATGEIPANIIYQTDKIIAFDDLYPRAPIHKLIIPQQHIATLNDINETHHLLLGELLQTTKKLAAELGIAESGYRTVINCNEGGGQVIFHLHIHLLGGRVMMWPPG